MQPEKHNTPRWMQRLIDRVIGAMSPLETSGEIRWYWQAPEDRPDAPWEIYCFPTEVEVMGGCMDGKRYTAGYTLCLTELLKCFKPNYHLHWLSRPRRGPGDFGGACVQVDGHIGTRPVLLHCFTYPPRDIGPTVGLYQDGTLRPKQQQSDEG